MATEQVDREVDVATWVAESRAAQGLPEGVTDAAVLDELAAMVLAAEASEGGEAA
jgi:hypothetical protein